MNRNCYRLRLHAHTAQLVPVAEIHSGRGRTPAGQGRSIRRHARAALALGLATLAPLAQSARLAANGVPVYDIAPADAQGLSHNHYPELQVSAPGAVFNNSVADGRSQLAGYLPKNPRLSAGTQASSILAEVQAGGAPSRLAGALEVFGPSAALIIANPNGLYANGLSTINVSQLRLLSASSQPGTHGLLLRTSAGVLEIGAGGVNTDGLSAFDLVAQHIKLNGPVGPGATRTASAVPLRAYAGVGDWDLVGAHFSPRNDAGVAAQISGSALGAMYGSHITLVASGSGAGVNLPGALFSASDLRIEADGAITLSSARASANMDLTAGQHLTLDTPAQTGPALFSGEALTLRAGGAFTARGDVLAGRGDIRLQAASLDNRARVTIKQGQLFLTLRGTLQNHGTLHAAKALELQAQRLDNPGILQSDANLQVLLRGALVNEGSLRAGGKMDVRASSVINRGGLWSAHTLQGRSDTLENSGPLLAQRIIWHSPWLQNQKDGSLTSIHDMQLQANTLTNDGTLDAADALALQLQHLTNRHDIRANTIALRGTTMRNAGLLRSKHAMQLEVAQSLDNDGTIQAATLQVNAGGLLRNHGSLLSAQQMQVQAATLENEGTLEATDGLDLQLQTLHNRGTVQGASLDATIGQALRNGDSGSLRTTGNMTLQADTLDNDGTLEAGDRRESGGTLTLRLQQLRNRHQVLTHTLQLHSGILDNQGLMRSKADMRLNVSQKIDNQATLHAGQNLFSNTPNLHNTGRATAGQDLALFATALTNSGHLRAQRTAQLDLIGYRNTGQIDAADLSLSTTEALVLDGHAPKGSLRLSISAPSLVVRQRLSTPGALTLRATQSDLDNDDAILAGGTLRLSARHNLNNRDGALIWSAADVGLRAENTLNNGINSYIGAGRTLALQADRQLLNHQGRIQSGGEMHIDTPRLENRATLTGSVRVDPEQGAILHTRRYAHYRAARWVNLEIKGFTAGRVLSDLRAHQGVIHAGGKLYINQNSRLGQSNQVLNQGRLESVGQMRIDADVHNESLSRPLSTRAYLEAVGPLQSQVWDSLASLNWEDRSYPSLYALLDYALAGSDNWGHLFGLYNYNRMWLSQTLALMDLTTAPELAKVLAQALGDDWRGIEAAERSTRWQAFTRGERGQSVNYYPEQRTVLGAFGGISLRGQLRNGDNVKSSPASTPDTALQDAMDQARNGWRDASAHPAKPGAGSEPASLPDERPADIDTDSAPKSTKEASTLVKTVIDGVPYTFASAKAHDDFLLAQQNRKDADARAEQDEVKRQKQRLENQRQAAFLRTQQSDDLLAALADTLANPHLFGHDTAQAQASKPYYETRLEFIDPGHFYGSDYFFKQIGYQPHTRQQVGGDNVFDATLIERQAERLLGAQTARQGAQGTAGARQFMANAAQVHKRLGLVVGQPLTRTQLDQLDRDIVWYVKVEHQGQQLLMPRVYLSAASRAAAQRIRDSGGAAITTAGLLDIDTGDGPAQDLLQRNALLLGQDIRIKAGGTVRLDNDDGVQGGAQADKTLDVAATDIFIRGGRVDGEDVALRARRNLEILIGMAATPDGSRRKDADSGVFANQTLTLSAGQTLHTRGATLSGEAVSLTANQLLLDEVREQAGTLSQTGNFGTFSYSVKTTQRRTDRGAGTRVQARNLKLRVTGDMGMLGGEIQAGQTDAHIGGDLITVASASHLSQRTSQHTLELVASARVGAGGQQASFTASTNAPVQTKTGKGNMSGAELKTGLQIASQTSDAHGLEYHNSQLNLGAGNVAIGGVFDIGGADLNADRAQAQARHEDTLQVQASRIVTTDYINESDSETSGWSVHIGNKTTAGSSLLDTATNLGTLGQQASEGREVDPFMTGLQVAGNITNLLLNDTAEAGTGMGIEGSYQRSTRRVRAGNTHTIGGSVSLRSTQGEIDLSGTTFEGGAHVALQAHGNLTLRQAEVKENDFDEQHNASLYVNGTASCNAFQASCGAGANVSAAGSSIITRAERTTQQHSNINAGQVTLSSGQDTYLIGAQVNATHTVTAHVGGNLNIITVQDAQTSNTHGGDWNASVGAAANTRTLGTPTFSLGATVRHEHDNHAIASQSAGILAGQNLHVRVRGDATLQGGVISAQGPGSAVHIQGRTTVSDVKDWRDHDGGYVGGSIGISATTSMPTGSLSGGRIAGEKYTATRRATLDAGQTSGQGSLQTEGGVSGTLNQDVQKMVHIEQDIKRAQNDISFTLSKADPLGRKARKQKRERASAMQPATLPRPAPVQEDASQAAPATTPSAPGTPMPAALPGYGKRIIILADSDPKARQAAERLTAKHPDTSTLMQRQPSGELQTLQAAPQPRSGPVKVQVVGHGDTTPAGAPTLGGNTATALVASLKHLPLEGISKVALVSCASGGCPGQDLTRQVKNALGTSAPEIKGYPQRIDVDADGRKHSVTQEGLGPKRDRSRPPAGGPPRRPPVATPAPAKAAGQTQTPKGKGNASTSHGATGEATSRQNPDVLAHYLSDPVNKARFDFVLGSDMENIDRTQDSAIPGMQVYQTGDPHPKHLYTNSITPDQWTIRRPDARQRPEPRFSTSDVAIASYIKAAQEGNFYNQRPKELTMILEPHETARLNHFTPDVPVVQFLTSAPTGTRAKRIMQAIGVEPTGLDFAKDSRQATLALKPKPQPTQEGDILAAHLAQPQRKQAIEQLLNSSEFHWRKLDSGPLTTYQVSDRETPLPRNLFVNAYSPDTWIMQSNTRLNQKRPYFANDVVLAQYATVSKQYGYYGKLPSAIVRDNINNAQTLAFFAAAGDTPDLQGFLKETPNGKHTQRILQSLQIHATQLEWDPEKSNAVIHVRPDAAPVLHAASPDETTLQAGATAPSPRYGKRIVLLSGSDAVARQAAQRLVAKHPSQTTLMRSLPNGNLRTLGPAARPAPGPVKIQVVGHGGQHDGTPTLGGQRPDQLAKTLRPLLSNDAGKVSLVSCASGGCAGKDFSSLLQAELPQATIKGYPQRVDVGPDGRKHSVTQGGLGPKRQAPRTPSDETAGPPAKRAKGATDSPEPGPSTSDGTAQAAPVPPGLEHYLSDAVNRQRFEFVQKTLTHTDVTDHPDYRIPGLNVIYSQDMPPKHRYRNEFNPDAWTLHPPLARLQPEPRFNTMDAVLAQSLVAARDRAQPLQRPRSVTFILGADDQLLPPPATAKQQFSAFLSQTPAGRQAQRLLQAFQTMPQAFTHGGQRATLIFASPAPDAPILPGVAQHPMRQAAQTLLMTSEEFHIKRIAPQSTTYELSDRDPSIPINSFQNAYSPDLWIMQANYRRDQSRPYFANDVVMAQYAIASQAYGYAGELPSRIQRENISNGITRSFFANEPKHRPDLQTFLTTTPNGKHTQRMLDNMQMYARTLKWDADEGTATIKVAPLAQRDANPVSDTSSSSSSSSSSSETDSDDD